MERMKQNSHPASGADSQLLQKKQPGLGRCLPGAKSSCSGEQYRDTHVHQHADDVIGNGDKGTGSYGGVDLQFLQRHRNESSENGRKHDNGEEAD